MTEIDVYRPTADVAVPDAHDTDSWITVVSDILKIANVIYDTPFVPDGLRGSAPAVAAAMLAGREMGLGIMTSLANIDVIRGKPTQKALLMRAMIQSRGHKWEDVDVSDTRVIIKGCRKGESTWMEASFTADQARKAGIDLGKYPVDKLYARASVRLARRKFADVIMGMPYSEEDIEDGTEGGETATINGTAPPAAQPAQRTARRRQAAPQTASPAEPQSRAADAQTPPAPAAGEAPMPPLPGEPDDADTERAVAKTQERVGKLADEPDDTDFDTPGTVTKAQVGKLQTVYHSQMAFTKAERDAMLTASEEIIRRGLLGPNDGRTHNNLSFNEAKTLIDTLERCGSRENLIALLADGEAPEAGDE